MRHCSMVIYMQIKKVYLKLNFQKRVHPTHFIFAYICVEDDKTITIFDSLTTIYYCLNKIPN